MISLGSRKLTECESRYSVPEKEALGAVEGVERNRIYLLGYPFQLLVDQASLSKVLSDNPSNNRLLRWRLRLSKYEFTVKHIKGQNNYLADFLSRLPDNIAQEMASVSAIVIQNPTDEPLPALDTGDISKALASMNISDYPDLQQQSDGLWTYKDTSRLFLPQALRLTIMQQAHHFHEGVTRCMNRIRPLYYWPNMDKDLQAFIQSCDLCRLKHSKRVSHNGKPMTGDPSPNHTISVDFLTSHKIRILVIQCLGSAYARLYRAPTATSETAVTFVFTWCTQFGLPQCILSDQGAAFISAIWKGVMSYFNIRTKYTATERPQTNGQNERLHRMIHHMMAVRSVDNDLTPIDAYLDFLSFGYNSTVSVKRDTPGRIFLGRDMRLPYHLSGMKETDLPSHACLARYWHMARILRRLEEWQLTDVALSSSNENYAEGQLVYAHLQGKWEGPYRILECLFPQLFRVTKLRTRREKILHSDSLSPANETS